MRNSNSTSVTRSSSSSTTHHHPQLLTHTAMADGYDFNRARSSESTENARAPGKTTTVAAGTTTTTATASSSDFGETSSSVSFGSSATAEDRGVPVSPKKLPPTPPRDHGSPYRPSANPPHENHHRASAGFGLGLLQPTMASSARSAAPRLPSQSQSHSQSQLPPFLRPSSWRAKEEDHGASIFRASPVLLSDASMQLSREHERYYTIRSCLAFDEDDDLSDDDEQA